jgi:hypothetical protein
LRMLHLFPDSSTYNKILFKVCPPCNITTNVYEHTYGHAFGHSYYEE